MKNLLKWRTHFGKEYVWRVEWRVNQRCQIDYSVVVAFRLILVEFHEEFHCIKYVDVEKRENVRVS
jgi:hypothetical protein